MNRFFLIFLLQIVVGPAYLLAAEPIEFGIVDYPSELSLTTESGPVGALVRIATGRGLTKISKNPNQPFELFVSDQFYVGDNLSKWSFRIRRGVVFHNGREVSLEDVTTSIERCSKGGTLHGISEISRRVEPFASGSFRNWVDITLDRSIISDDGIREFPIALSRCSIYPAEELALFGSEWGYGTNLIGVGPFAITGFRPGKSVTLTRFDDYLDSRAFVETVTLRGFKSAQEALSALRMGTITLFVGPDSPVILEAQNDETLTVDKCSIGNVVYRRTFRFSCNPEIDVISMSYVG